MSASVNKVYGKLELKDIPNDICWDTPEKFLKQMERYFGITLDVNSNVDFVVVGAEVPSEDDKGRLWVKLYNNGTFDGFYKFEGGKWVNIQNRRQDEVVWFYGDSRSIPPGYLLIDENNGLLSTSNIKHIMSFYNQDMNSGTESPVYTYFACTYIGTTVS